MGQTSVVSLTGLVAWLAVFLGSMMKNEDVLLLQCACCDFQYKKTWAWLEQAHSLRCVCDQTLDVDDVFNQVILEDKKPVYLIYPR